MKQCARCNALFSPRLDECPSCRRAAPATPAAPQAWVRTRSKTKTRRLPAVDRPRAREADPPSGDVTVELTREFLAEHSSELLGLIESSKADLVDASSLWSELQDSTPTAKVFYLGEDDPDSYDLDDLIDPPTPQAIQNILQHGTERVAERDQLFADLDALEELFEVSSVATLEAPSTDAIAEHARMAKQVLERSRAVAALATPVLPPAAAAPVPAPAAPAPPQPPPAPQVSPMQNLPVELAAADEEWTFGGDAATTPRSPARRRTVSSGVAHLAALGLGATATWAAATGVAVPVVLALFVGAAAIVALTARR